METIDDTNSRWVYGAECVLTGLPMASSPTGSNADPATLYLPEQYFTNPNVWGDASACTTAGLSDVPDDGLQPHGDEQRHITAAAYGIAGTLSRQPKHRIDADAPVLDYQQRV